MHWITSLACLGVCMLTAVGRSLESGIWEGYVIFGRGGSSFTPCGSKETWWVKSKGYSKIAEKLQEDYNNIAQKPYELVYARLRGDVSRKGQYGRLGSYQRVLYVEEVLDIRPKRDDDCE
ncbi:MAG TPA: hypothetical protein PKZ84_15545 [Anaerolineae bacterium]|nr:hypothetical protein [Anaerolineae bacterium]HQI85198.1 hypothetical protein [Anaerolineae bacterium]